MVELDNLDVRNFTIDIDNSKLGIAEAVLIANTR